jgi:hypothetical protein
MMSIHWNAARKYRRRTALALACVFSCSVSLPSVAATIAQWNFNQAIADNVNSPAPSIGSGVATIVGMRTGANPTPERGDILNAGGTPSSSDPGVPNTAWRVRGNNTNGWSGDTQLLSGAQFKASTVGYNNITVSFDLNATDGSPRHAQLMYTTDGTNFSPLGALLDNNPFSDAWHHGITYDFSAIPAANNNANFGFKVVSAFSPVEFTNANGVQPANTAFQRTNAGDQVYNGTAGNYRFDMVTFSGTLIVPEPTAGILAGMALTIAIAFRRARRNRRNVLPY